MSLTRGGPSSALWQRYIVNGAVLVSYKALVLAPFVIAAAFRSGEIGGLKVIFWTAVLLCVAGSFGGVAYGLAAHRGVRYYARWVIAAEVVLLVVFVSLFTLGAGAFEWSDLASEAPVVFFFFTRPTGWLMLAGTAAIGGLVYGRMFDGI